VAVDAWTFIWLMLGLKIPLIALFLLVRWAVAQPPQPATDGGDGGIGPALSPHHPHHPRSRPPRPRRRGPHGDPATPAPARMRVRARAKRISHR
jgi:hypothetical protein